MELEVFKYTEIQPHPYLEGIVAHYRVKKADFRRPFNLIDYSSLFQGLIFAIYPMDDVVLRKKGGNMPLKHKVYFVGQALSPSQLGSGALCINIIAVNFTPTGVFRLTGIDLNECTDKIIDAELIFGKAINELYDRILALEDSVFAIALIEDFLCARAEANKKQNRSCVLHSVSVLQENFGDVRVKMLHQLTGASPRTLERAFKSEIGMTPKMYQRLIRYNYARQYMEKYRNKDWQEVIHRFGFYDQSHFIGEFQRFTGKTPVQYVQSLYRFYSTCMITDLFFSLQNLLFL